MPYEARGQDGGGGQGCQGVLCRCEDRHTKAARAAVGAVGPGVSPSQSQSPGLNDRVVSATERGQIALQSHDGFQKAMEASGRIQPGLGNRIGNVDWSRQARPR